MSLNKNTVPKPVSLNCTSVKKLNTKIVKDIGVNAQVFQDKLEIL